MSKTFSKILVICALSVILPLMIIGTSLAAYYSLNATMAVGIQLDELSASSNAYAKVVYNKSTHYDKFEINAGHTKTITLRAEAKGYEFKGWYEGSLEAYAASEGQWIDQENNTLEIKISDADDVLAVFDVQKYNVEYHYQSDPNSATTTDAAPAGWEGALAYGRILPTTAAFAHYDGYEIIGWDLLDPTTKEVVDDNNGAHYKVAEFPELDAYVLKAVWNADEAITLTYKYNDTTLGTANGYVTAGKVIADPADYATAAGVELAAGEKLVWKVNGNIVAAGSKLHESTTLNLEKVDVTYTLTITPGEDMELASGAASATVAFTKEDAGTRLAAILNNVSWKSRYSFWTFAGVKIGANTYTNAADILTAFKTASAHAEATLAATSVLAKNFTTISVATAKYRTTDEEDLDDATFDANVYQLTPETAAIGTSVLMDSVASTTTIEEWIFKGLTFYKEDETTEVSLYEFYFDGYGITIDEEDLQEIETINDLIDVFYTRVGTKPSGAAELAISTLSIRFI